MLDTADACVALLVAYLVHAGFLRGHRWQDALLAQGLVLLALASSGVGLALGSLPGVRAGTLEVWLPLAARVGGAILIVGAALADGRPARSATWLRRPWTVPATLVAVATAVLWASRDWLPVAVETVAAAPGHPLLSSHAALLEAQVFSGLCFFVASIAFAVQSTRREDELLRWLGPACALAAFARVHYVLFPSLYTDWLYTGDLLRTGCYLLFLVGAGRELGQYWTARLVPRCWRTGVGWPASCTTGSSRSWRTSAGRPTGFLPTSRSASASSPHAIAAWTRREPRSTPWVGRRRSRWASSSTGPRASWPSGTRSTWRSTWTTPSRLSPISSTP